MTRVIVATLAAAALLAGLGVGCQGKFTRQRYETIYASMPDWRVQKVLGEPDATTNDKWSYVHRRPDYYSATITFSYGRVIDKSWSVEKPKARPE